MHGALRRIDPAIVADRGADHDDAMAHDRSGRDLEFAGPSQRLARIDLYLAAFAEIGAGLTGFGIERDHARIVGAREDARPACRTLGRLLVAPVGDAAAVVTIGRILAETDLRIEAPLLPAGGGIERDHFIKRRAHDDAAFDEQRRHLQFRARHHLPRTRRQISGVKCPGRHQIADIARRDPVQRRETRASAVAAPVIPRRRRRIHHCRKGHKGKSQLHVIPL